MALNLVPIIPTKSLTDILLDIDNNFNKIVSNGGGIQGIQGIQGIPGVGSVGATGADGADGERGSLWSISSINPITSLSNKQGDCHLNITDSSVWRFGTSSWNNIGNLSNTIFGKNSSFDVIFNSQNSNFLWLTDNNTITPPNILGAKLKISTNNNHIRLSYLNGSTDYETQSSTISVIDTNGTLSINSAYKTKIIQADDLEFQGLNTKYSKFQGFLGVNIESVLNVGLSSTIDSTNFSINANKGIKLKNVISFDNGSNIARIHFQNYNGLTSTNGSYIESRLTATNNGYLKMVGDYGSTSYITIQPNYNEFGGYYQLIKPSNNGTAIEQGIKYDGYGIAGFYQKYSDFSIEALSKNAGNSYDGSSLILKAGSINSTSISGSGVAVDGDGGSIFLQPGEGSVNGNVILNLERITNSVVGMTLIGTASSSGSYRLQVNGNAYKNSGGGTWAIPSDRRLKENIEYLENEKSLELIDKMKPVSFNYIAEKDANYFGFIAQDFEQVIPEMVKYNENGYLSMSYGNMDALVISAIKALKERISELEKQLLK